MIIVTPTKPMPDFTTDKSIAKASSAADRPSSDGGVAASKRYRLTLWRELASPKWKSTPPVTSEDISKLDDADPRARDLLARMRSAWDEAPPNPTLDGAAVRTAGYVVPIEESREGMREFLLVPYYGACIHIPPPPANQIIDVSTSHPIKGLDSMDTVWVEGVLKVARTAHDSGASTYAMRADDVEPYDGPSR
jgi:hypothetical protein